MKSLGIFMGSLRFSKLLPKPFGVVVMSKPWQDCNDDVDHTIEIKFCKNPIFARLYQTGTNPEVTNSCCPEAHNAFTM